MLNSHKNDMRKIRRKAVSRHLSRKKDKEVERSERLQRD